MKNTLLVMAAALLVAGCDQQNKQASNDTSSDQDAIRQSAKEAKSEVEKQAKAAKDRLDAEAKAAQAQIDAEKARAKAAATDAQTKVETASQNIREAAGAASDKAQREVGAGATTTTPPPSEPSATPTPATPSTTSAPGVDQKLADQVRAAVSGAEANADAAKDLQISATGGTVTVKGKVKSDAEKTRIENAAKAIPGVSQVVMQVEVQPEQ